MVDDRQQAVDTANEMHARAVNALESTLSAANPEAVYGKPEKIDEVTLITASEVVTGLGLGFGSGLGRGRGPARQERLEEDDSFEFSAGVGGGGGGGSQGRPVAVIKVSGDQVEVHPVIDITKLGLAALTALGSMFMMFSRMSKASRGE